MAKIRRVTLGGTSEENLHSLSEQVSEILQVLGDRVEFGEPVDPNDPTSAVLAGGTGAGTHNGVTSNIMGSWVELSLTATGISDQTCNHNLYLTNNQYTVPVAGKPNVRWLPFAVMHDGTGKDATSFLDVEVEFLGGTVSANSIVLRVRVATVGTAVTVDASHPVRVTLFFTQATKGP